MSTHNPESRSTHMLHMSDDEARAAGLYLVIGPDGTPTSDRPVERVARARRLVDELRAMVRKVLRDGFNPYRLEHVRDGLGELHVDFDMLGEELHGWEFTAVVVAGIVQSGDPAADVEHPAATAETAAKLADELAALTEAILRDGFDRYRLDDLLGGLYVMGDDFSDLETTLRLHAVAGDRGAA